MNTLLRITLYSIIGLIALYFITALILITRPAPTFAIDPIPVPNSAAAEFTPREFTMRDGEMLFARQFPTASEDTILLVHGVTSDSGAFNASAEMLRDVSDANVIAIDLRGHGQSGGTAGDVDYIGQYEDDVADVIEAIRAERPNGRLVLAGHSMGGGVALRYAQLEGDSNVDGFLLFAPHLGTTSPTMPQPSTDPAAAEMAAMYSQLHIPRLIGLTMFNVVGMKFFNQQETLYFNLTDNVTHTYSYRAMVNTSPAEYQAALGAVDAPMLVVVGSNDEAFVADEYAATVGEFSDGEVHVLDGENHNSIYVSAEAMDIIESWMGEPLVTAR